MTAPTIQQQTAQSTGEAPSADLRPAGWDLHVALLLLGGIVALIGSAIPWQQSYDVGYFNRVTYAWSFGLNGLLIPVLGFVAIFLAFARATSSRSWAHDRRVSIWLGGAVVGMVVLTGLAIQEETAALNASAMQAGSWPFRGAAFHYVVAGIAAAGGGLIALAGLLRGKISW